MKYSQYCFSSLSIGLLFLTSCAGTKQATQPARTETAPVVATSMQPNSSSTTSTQPRQVFAPGSNIRMKPVAGLIQSTNPDKRRIAIAQGRRDPFAPIVPGPASLAPQQPKLKAPPKLPPVSTAPTVTTIPLPVLQPTNITPNLPNPGMPSTSIPSTTVPVRSSPTALADAIQIMGVMKMGNNLNAIVRSPEEPSGRSIKAGDYLANGQVYVKQIEMKTQGDPIVVLEQNGIEVIKSVSAPAVSSL